MPSVPSPSRQWLKIRFFCPLPLLEAAEDLMGVLSGSGVEQSPESASGALVSAFFSLDSEEADAVHGTLARVEGELAALFALYGHNPPEKLETAFLADEDWATSWRQYFTSFEIVPGLVIQPSWENGQGWPGRHILKMDPGMAFGTGQHASTQMALALLAKSMRERKARRVLDVGTGTGILAMAAALFGAKEVLALDNDPAAVAVAAENVEKNALTSRVAVSGQAVEEISGHWEMICANIVHDVLSVMAPALAGLLPPGGRLILSGILSGVQEEHLVALYSGLGLEVLDRLQQEEWSALLFAQGGERSSAGSER